MHLAGEKSKVALFVMTLPDSDAIYIQAFPRECTEVFLEGHRRAFEFLDGVPTRISYDNAKVAVAKVPGDRERKVTAGFQRLMSHFLFESHFCLVRRPNEKGHVERLLDFARRNFLVPVPRVDSLETLNEQLATACRLDLDRQLRGKGAPKKELLIEEQHPPGVLKKAVESALEVGAADPDAIRLIMEYQEEHPVSLFSLDGRPHLKMVRVPPTDISAYGNLMVGG